MPKARGVNHRKPWAEEDFAFLRREYPHRTGGELAEMLGRDKRTVYQYAHKLGLSKRKAINGAFFDEWSPEMAWVMGFWVADGWATDDNCQYLVAFCQTTRPILDRIKALLESGHAIGERKNPHLFSFKAYNKNLYEGLKAHLPFKLEAKSLHTAWPIDMPDEYASHFCRGMIDGDGYLGFNSERPQLVLTSGSKLLLDQFTFNVNRLTGIEGHIYQMSSGSYSYIVNSTKARCLAHWLYEDCGEFCLKRKYRVYQTFLDWMPQQIYRATVTPLMEKTFPGLLVKKGRTKHDD